MEAFKNACRAHDVERVRQLIDEEGFDVNQTDLYGWTPLTFATYHARGCTPIVQVLVDGSVCDNYEIMNILLNAGADINFLDTDNHTIFYRACGMDDVEKLWILYERGADINITKFPIHRAAMFGNAQQIAALIAMGFDVNELDEQGRLPLHHAVQPNSPENVEILLHASARLNVVDEQGRTPKEYARSKGCTSSYNILQNFTGRVHDAEKYESLIQTAKDRLAAINAKRNAPKSLEDDLPV